MKITRFCAIAVLLCSFIPPPAYSQNKKLDKALKKADGYYNAGSFSKALKALNKFKSGALKISAQNNYTLAFHLREARINLAIGLVDGFETSLSNALTTSQAVFGETSTSYANTMMDVGQIYNEYGNYRIGREYIEKAEALLVKTDQMNDAFRGKIALLKAEAMIGQGFANEAIELLSGVENYFAARAVDKETQVENGQIKTARLEEPEIFTRHNEYAQLKTLVGMAYAKKGRIAIPGANAENPDVDVAFQDLQTWIRNKRRFLGELSLADVKYRYLWAKALEENGSKQDLEYDKILNDLKKKNGTNKRARPRDLSQLCRIPVEKRQPPALPEHKTRV